MSTPLEERRKDKRNVHTPATSTLSSLPPPFPTRPTPLTNKPSIEPIHLNYRRPSRIPPKKLNNALAASYPLLLECSLLSQWVYSAPQRRCGPAPSHPIRHLPARMELIVELRQVNTDVARFKRCRSGSSGSSRKAGGSRWRWRRW